MTMLLARSAGNPGASLCDLAPQVDRSAETIDSYDRGAEHYATRLAQANFEPYLRRFADELCPGAVVLDGGCGGGRDLQWMAQHGLATIGLDLSMGMLAKAHVAAPTATLLHGDLQDIPLPDATVDGVWLCASLLHLAADNALTALEDVNRVLTPGGTVFLSTASGQGSEWRTTELGRRWFQLYEEAELVDLMSEAGLHVVDSVTEPGVVQGCWVNITARKKPQ